MHFRYEQPTLNFIGGPEITTTEFEMPDDNVVQVVGRILHTPLNIEFDGSVIYQDGSYFLYPEVEMKYTTKFVEVVIKFTGNEEGGIHVLMNDQLVHTFSEQEQYMIPFPDCLNYAYWEQWLELANRKTKKKA